MIVINLWGGPSSGKSTTAAGLFFLMKINKFKVELITEYAKDLVLNKDLHKFKDQRSLFAEQNWRQARLLDHEYDFAITDSPILLPILYAKESDSKLIDKLATPTFRSYTNLNYFLDRSENTFEKIGRIHNEEESIAKDNEILKLLEERGLDYKRFEATPKTPEILLADIRKYIEVNPIDTLPFSGLN